MSLLALKGPNHSIRAPCFTNARPSRNTHSIQGLRRVPDTSPAHSKAGAKKEKKKTSHSPFRWLTRTQRPLTLLLLGPPTTHHPSSRRRNQWRAKRQSRVRGARRRQPGPPTRRPRRPRRTHPPRVTMEMVVQKPEERKAPPARGLLAPPLPTTPRATTT